MRVGQLSDRFYVCGQISVDDVGPIARFGIRTIINNRPDNEDAGQPTSAEIARAAAEHGLDYLHVPVVSGAITAENVAEFNLACATAASPILLFCRSGARCATLWQLSDQSG